MVSDELEGEFKDLVRCLNPCFNGIWSRTLFTGTAKMQIEYGLNPCFNGIWSRTAGGSWVSGEDQRRLNPCFNGIWSRTIKNLLQLCRQKVLILVLMEYGLGQVKNYDERTF